MEVKVYSPGIVSVEIYGINFAMPERDIRELIRLLTNVLFDLRKSKEGGDVDGEKGFSVS